MTMLLQTGVSSARALMERELAGGRPLAPEYPLIFDPRFDGELLALEEQGQVRSACTLLVREFLMGGTRLRGGLIGSVVTDPEHRREGHGTRLMDRAEEVLRGSGCAFSMLWSSDPNFYLGRGYGPVGGEYDFQLPLELASRLPQASGVRSMRATDARELHGLYERHAARLCRTLEETQALLAIQGMNTLVLERAGHVVAYACLGRGLDFAHTIHEWGGATDDVLALLRAHLERRAASSEPGQLYLVAPVGARDLTRRLEDLGTPVSRNLLGLAKILDREVVALRLTELLAPHGRVGLAPEGSSDTFTVRGPKDLGTLDDDGAIALLMGVAEVRAHVADFLARFGLESAKLPLEPFVWGLDSI